MGDAAGLARPGALSVAPAGPLGLRPGDLAFLAFLAFLAVLARAALSGPRDLRAAPALLLAVCLASGFALGRAAARRAADSCVAGLAPDAELRADGWATRDLPAAGAVTGRAGASLRLGLSEVELRAGGRRCRVPSLLTRVRPPPRPVRAGERVTVAGAWWSWDPAREGEARPLARYGLLRGRVTPGTAGGGARGEGKAGVLLRARAAVARRLDARLPPDVAAAGRALLLARRDGLPPGFARRFAEAGLAHLLAISGLHVGLLAAGLVGLAGVVVGGPGRYPVAAAGTLAYVLFIGAPPAASRAGLMVAGWSAGKARGSPVRASELLGLAAGAAVVADPMVLVSPGYQLSFAGFAGLLVGGRIGQRAAGRLRGRTRRGIGSVPGRALVALAAGAGAFAATAPFAAAHFQRVAPAAVLSNFAGVPLVAASLAGLFGAAAVPGLPGELAGEAAALALRALFRVVDLFAALPGGHGPASPPGPLFWPAAGLLFLAALRAATGASAARCLPPAAAAAALWLAGPLLAGWRAGPHTLLCNLDVGQGDAAVIRTRAGRWIVLDAGPRSRWDDAGVRVVVPFLRDHGARGVELFLLSHPDRDHLGGAGALMDAFRVGRVLDAGNPVPSPEYLAFLDRVEEEGARWLPARPGDRHRVDEVELLVLGPDPPGPSLADARPPNEASVAVRVRVAGTALYVDTGDAPAAGERRLLERWPADSVRAPVLKAGHHGSRTSSDTAWLRAVGPRIVVVSAGAGNRYGHPHPEVLDRLGASGAERVWRTDRDGRLCLEVDADGRWRVRGGAWREPPRAGAAASRGPVSAEERGHGTESR